MYEPPRATKRSKSRKVITRVFLLLFFTAAVAGSMGYMEGQGVVVSGKENLATANVTVTPTPTNVPKPAPKPPMAENQKNNPCEANSKEEICRSKCATTYITEKNEKETCSPYLSDNPISAKLQALYKCLITVDSAAKKLNIQDVANQFCTIKKFSKNGEPLTAAETGTHNLKIPRKCKTQFTDIISSVKADYKKTKKTTATLSEGKKCAYKGASNCIQYPGESKYTCWPKNAVAGKALDIEKFTQQLKAYCAKHPQSPTCKSGGGGGNYTGPSSSNIGSGSGGNSASSKGFLDMFGKSLLMSQMTGAQNKNNNSSGSGSSGNSCDSYYYRLTHRADCEGPREPTCLLLLNKTSVKKGEALQVKWKTEYAKSISLTAGTSTEATLDLTAQEGETTIYPQASGTITLKASSEDESSEDEIKCSKVATITVSGVAGDEGEFAPRLSCIPGNIESGSNTRSAVTWSCATGDPSSSLGVNIDTNGELAGSVDVYPTKSTKYQVGCYKDGALIGRNSCVVLVEEPIFDIIVYPTTATVGEKVRVSWGSLGMSSCRVRGPGNFLYERPNGVVATVPFQDSSDDEAIYTITCASKYGGTSTRDIVVDLDN